MNNKQRENIAKYFYDLSKGLVIGAAVGLGTNKVSVLAGIIYLTFSLYCLASGYLLDGENND